MKKKYYILGVFKDMCDQQVHLRLYMLSSLWLQEATY